MTTTNFNVLIGITVTLFLMAAGCESPAPTAITEAAPELPSLPQQQQELTENEPDSEEDSKQDSGDGAPPGWVPMPGATCTFIDLRQRRVESVDGLRVTVRILAETTVDGNLFARAWLHERHGIRLGDFDLENGEITYFVVTVPQPGRHRLVIDVEANDRDRNHTQCDFSLTVDV